MVTLYIKSTCPFCRRVLAVVDRLDLECDIKDITTDDAILAELEAHGGKTQVPYLVDEATGEAMYESDAIVSYLQKQYGQPVAATRPRIHVGGSACISCEG